MRRIDERAVEQPAIGRFVETAEPVWQLEENTLYVLPTVPEQTRTVADDILCKVEEVMDLDDYINTYSHYVMDEDLVLNDNAELDGLLKSGEYDFILPMNRPGNDKSLYLLAKTDERGVYETVCLMFYTAERVSKQAGADMVKAQLLANPGETISGLTPSLASQEFRQNYLASGAHILYHRTFGMAPSLEALYEQIGIRDDESDFVKNNKMLAHLSELAEQATKDKDANDELNLICKSIPSEYFAEMFKRMTPAHRAKSAKVVNPEFMAAQSPMRIEVCERDAKKAFFKKYPPTKNDGKYVIFFTKDSREEKISFSHKNCFIVYLIFLLDRYKKGEEIDSIDIYKVKDLYLDLYGIVYPGNANKLGSYESLTNYFVKDPKSETGAEKFRRTKYGACLKEIRMKVTNACNRLGEFPFIHFIPSEKEHIRTAKDRIVIPFQLLKKTM